MAHFAELDSNDKVLRVIVVNNDDIKEDGLESEAKGIALCKSFYGEDTIWIQTSYNGNFRGQFTGQDGIYLRSEDRFIFPKPYPSWVLDENYFWQAPVERPDDEGKSYNWDEATLAWVEITKPL